MNITREQYTAYFKLWYRSQARTMRFNVWMLFLTSLLCICAVIYCAWSEVYDVDITLIGATATVLVVTRLYYAGIVRSFNVELQHALVISELIERAIKAKRREQEQKR